MLASEIFICVVLAPEFHQVILAPECFISVLLARELFLSL
jgi:hypothetical protein